MNKQEFIEKMQDALRGLPEAEVSERLSFYIEMIDDRIEEGLTEGEAVASVGTVDEIVTQITSEIPLGKMVKEKVKRQRSLKAWQIVLIILGFPVWFPLLVSAFAIIFSLYVVLWSVVVSLWAVFGSLAGSSVGGIVGGIILMFGENPFSGIALIGAAIFCAGLSIFVFLGCRAATKGTARLAPKIILLIKKCFRSSPNDSKNKKTSSENNDNTEYKNANGKEKSQ